MPTGVYEHKSNQLFQNGHVVSEETKKKISNSLKGQPPTNTPEGNRKISRTLMGHKVSEETRRKISEAGIKYKGRDREDYLNNNIGIRCSPEYPKWRDAVIRRDHHTCQLCHRSDVKVGAHHIKNWRDYPGERFAIDNGITLCIKNENGGTWSCHNIVEHKQLWGS